MSPPLQRSAIATTAITGLLANSARELSRIGDQLDDLQKALSRFLTAAANRDTSVSHAGLQSLDSITQHVRALSELYSEISSGQVDDAGIAKAVGQVSLSALATRLSGGEYADDHGDMTPSAILF